jgi:metal-responsive CopG/Arc/MetJ family transcriptional regulator
VVDEYARSEDQSRSFVIKEAIESYLKEEVERRSASEAAQIYAQIEKSDRQLSEEFLSISSETLSPPKRKDRKG